MKKIKRIVIMLLGVAVLSGCMSDKVKIMTYNVRHCQGMDGRLDVARTAGVINEFAPDVAGISEIDVNTKRSQNIDEAAELARRTGMYATFMPTLEKYDGGQYGILLLTKDAPQKVNRIKLEVPAGSEARGIVMAEFADAVYCTTHLTLGADSNRTAAVRTLLALARNSTKPIFIMGDFNATPTSETINTLRAGYAFLSRQNTGTYHGKDKDNGKCIDFIAVDKNHLYSYRPLEATVVMDEVTSDHKPVTVSLLRRDANAPRAERRPAPAKPNVVPSPPTEHAPEPAAAPQQVLPFGESIPGARGVNISPFFF